MYIAGVILPLNLATLLLRLLIHNYPEALADYQTFVHLLCISLQHYYVTWISPWYYMSITAILFRFAILY